MFRSSAWSASSFLLSVCALASVALIAVNASSADLLFPASVVVTDLCVISIFRCAVFKFFLKSSCGSRSNGWSSMRWLSWSSLVAARSAMIVQMTEMGDSLSKRVIGMDLQAVILWCCSGLLHQRLEDTQDKAHEVILVGCFLPCYITTLLPRLSILLRGILC